MVEQEDNDAVESVRIYFTVSKQDYERAEEIAQKRRLRVASTARELFFIGLKHEESAAKSSSPKEEITDLDYALKNTPHYVLQMFAMMQDLINNSYPETPRKFKSAKECMDHARRASLAAVRVFRREKLLLDE